MSAGSPAACRTTWASQIFSNNVFAGIVTPRDRSGADARRPLRTAPPLGLSPQSKLGDRDCAPSPACAYPASTHDLYRTLPALPHSPVALYDEAAWLPKR